MRKFMELPEEYSNENSKFVILPIEYEKDVTYGKGASKGPDAIIKSSKHLEYYDEEFNVEPFIKGIKLADTLKLNICEPKVAMEEIVKAKSKYSDKFVIGLGGDHSVTIGLTKDIDASVIILDAHADLKYSWNNSTLNHACVSRRISAENEVLVVGVRSMDITEKECADETENVELITTHEYNEKKLEKALNKLKNKVYISIDVDVFDQAFIRNTGTPEPGGFTWQQVINILKKIFEIKDVIGADIVEFSPNENYEAESYALARLIYKLTAMKLIFQKE